MLYSCKIDLCYSANVLHHLKTKSFALKNTFPATFFSKNLKNRMVTYKNVIWNIMQHVKRRSGTSFGKECVIQREKLSLLSVFFCITGFREKFQFSGAWLRAV